jgi:DTW domain-containing protein YfiP
VPLRNEPKVSPHRQRCYVCYRPAATCFCAVIPSVNNRTHVLILQHVKERFHAFNTARIVKQALRNSTLVVDQTLKLANGDLPFAANTGVLFPGEDAQLLSEIPVAERPDQLIILDGTWHHARTFMRQIPALSRLPKFRLEPAAPSNYRIRKEPTESSLSTLEATVEALRALEPETEGLDQLLQAFDTMIDTQVGHPRQAGRLRLSKRPTGQPSNIPHVLLDDLQNVVVAYGESSHGRNDSTGPRQPVYWVAQRLGTGESFECAIQSPASNVPSFLQHLELCPADFRDAVSPEGFSKAWQKFLKPTDTLAVFNQSTVRLLSSSGAVCTPYITLKSVDIQRDSSTLDGILKSLKLTPVSVSQKGRAGRRLGNAIAYTTWLHHRGS